MPRTDIVRVYRAKGNSDTLAVVIPKTIRSSLHIKRGERFQATTNSDTGQIIFSRVST